MNTANVLHILKRTGLLLSGALILCSLAFYNNYPLLFPDSGSYIRAGFENWVPPDRPILYGLFIRHMSLAYTLWTVIIVQSFLVSYVLLCFIERLLKTKHPAPLFIGILIPLVLLTGLAIHSGQVLPDIFSALAILCLILLLLPRGESSFSQHLFLMLIYEFSLCVHNSNILVHVLTAGLITLLFLWKKIRKQETGTLFQAKRIVSAWALILAPFLLVPSLNTMYNAPFQLTSSSHIFMMNHLVETGILEKYLHENCETKNYKICRYKDSLTTDFIWDLNSPLYKTGGWDVNKPEYNAIIHDILTTPRYLKMYCTKSIQYTLKQFFSFDFAGVVPPCLPGSSPYYSLNRAIPDEIRECMLGLQQRGKLNLSLLGFLQPFVVFLSALGLYLLYLSKRLSPFLLFAVQVVFIALLVNAFACGTFSTVAPRYQSRVVWLVPLLFLIALAPYLRRRIKDWMSKAE